MPKKSKLKLLPLDLETETLGERLVRLRKERGFTQVELAKKIGITQVLVSDYERERLRPHYEMIIRLAQALEVTTDQLLGVKLSKNSSSKPNLKLIQRLKKIEALPAGQQKALLKTIDTFIENFQLKKQAKQ
jgi:transcriptional regulator with XRE-family HTH domain